VSLLHIYLRKLERCGRSKQPSVSPLAQMLCVCLPDINEDLLAVTGRGVFVLFMEYLIFYVGVVGKAISGICCTASHISVPSPT
jgi:hypothetical protein